MQIGMIGLGRMGANMVRRLMRAGHQCVVHDLSPESVQALGKEGAVGSTSLSDFAAKLTAPRAICVMVPVAGVDSIIDALVPHLTPNDVVVDGGNSHYQDDIARVRGSEAARLLSEVRAELA